MPIYLLGELYQANKLHTCAELRNVLTKKVAAVGFEPTPPKRLVP